MPASHDIEKDLSPDAIKQRLRWLGNSGLTSRSGLPSSRNLAKRYRPPRMIIDPKTGKEIFDPLEMMKMGPDNKPRQSNGSFGDKSTFQGGGGTSKPPTQITGWDPKKGKYVTAPIEHKINDRNGGRFVVRKGLPGRIRNAPNRKRLHPNSSGLHDTSNLANQNQELIKSQFFNLRNDLLTAKWVGELLEIKTIESDALVVLQKVDEYIRQRWPEMTEKLDKRDWAAYSTLVGRVKARQLKMWKPIKSLGQRLEKAAVTLASEQNQLILSHKNYSKVA